jgi:hypothetical protein
MAAMGRVLLLAINAVCCYITTKYGLHYVNDFLAAHVGIQLSFWTAYAILFLTSTILGVTPFFWSSQ